MLADVLPFSFALDQTRASEAGKRSGQVRRERSFHAKTFDKPPTVDKVQAQLNAQAKIVECQIEQTCKALNGLNGEVTHANRAQLLKALDTLLDRQRVLLNVPDPGTNRPSKTRPDRNQPNLAPVAAQARPVIPQPIDFSGYQMT